MNPTDLYEFYGVIHVKSCKASDQITTKLNEIDKNLVVQYEELDRYAEVFFSGCCELTEEEMAKVRQTVKEFDTLVDEPQILEYKQDNCDDFIYIGPPEQEKATVSEHFFNDIVEKIHYLSTNHKNKVIKELQYMLKMKT